MFIMQRAVAPMFAGVLVSTSTILTLLRGDEIGIMNNSSPSLTAELL